MKKRLILNKLLILFFAIPIAAKGININVKSTLYLKKPGNPSQVYSLKSDTQGWLSASEELPLEIKQQNTTTDTSMIITLTIKAKEEVYYNLEESCPLPSMNFNDCEFLMPGFWYRKNLRSPQEAPSLHTSNYWTVREDRLSSPLTGVFNEKSGDYFTVLRSDKISKECLSTHKEGEIILAGETAIGFTGFKSENNNSSLVFGFPYCEGPKTYIRKLTLAPAVRAFEKLTKGQSRTLTWEIRKGNTTNYSQFVAQTWNANFDHFRPQVVNGVVNDEQAKVILSNFFKESYVDRYDLKYYSGVELRTDDCKSTGIAEVGFVGRVLLNAFNALEYGESHNRADLSKNAQAIFDSYLAHGFTSNGFIREQVDFERKHESEVYSIRRQSEGVLAILSYLDYEKKQGRSHPEWEKRLIVLLNNFAKLQSKEGHFPRKFDNEFKIIDPSGGSTPSATIPLTMAYKYFKQKSFLESAKRTGVYLEKELISKSDYFSSTLDANCEDKEASLYASTAMYYLAMVTKGKEQQHYITLSKEAAYFALSWYYLWDVPFAQGQMLGDVHFQSRGWGNVSVENNHVDVFIFEFASVLDYLAKATQEPRFSTFSKVIRSSMLQLMPTEEQHFDIAKVGYYPEVVQHTNWDYGKNGKGFYNDIFAPGWTIASLWQMMSPNRVHEFFNKK